MFWSLSVRLFARKQYYAKQFQATFMKLVGLWTRGLLLWKESVKFWG